MRFTRSELSAFRGRTLPDLLGPETRLLFVGINPGLRAIGVQAPFGGGGSNRFYPALHLAGILDRRIDASAGLLPEDLAHLHARGIGITSLVAGATARADELTVAQLRDGVASLERRVRRVGPRVTAFLGITAYRTAFGRPGAVVGLQPELLGGAALRVVPNPSGLNRGTSLAELATAYREAAVAAGITPYDVPAG